MKITEALTISSLKDNFSRLVEETATIDRLEIHTTFIDTAGIQFLMALKKYRPSQKIEFKSEEAIEAAALIGADKCLKTV